MYLETEMEVLYVDIFVRSSFALAPQQETLFGCHLLNGNILDGESQNDGPDHTQCHLKVAVNDFFRTDRDQLDAFRCDEVQSFVDICNLIKCHVRQTLIFNTNHDITLWKRIFPRSGFGRVSPEITSSRSINLRPLRKSSSMLSIAVPALRK